MANNLRPQGGEKLDCAQRSLRVHQVYKWISEGYRRPELMQASIEEWNVTDRTVDLYISEAKKILREQLERERDEVLAEHIAIRRNLFRKTINSMPHVAMAAIRDEAQLIGLYETADNAIKLLLSLGYEIIDPSNPQQNITQAARAVEEADPADGSETDSTGGDAETVL